MFARAVDVYILFYYFYILRGKVKNMDELLNAKFVEWTGGKDALQARRSIYEKVRDIPYAIIPELNDSRRYIEIVRYGKGSCMPKHILLGSMFERLGLSVLYAVFPFKWGDAEVDYPPHIKKLADELPMSHHLACRVDIDGNLVLIDATLDPALEKLGLPVNRTWDGFSDTMLPVDACGEEQLYHPLEVQFTQARTPDEQLTNFYNELNRWLEDIRRH